MPPASTDFSTLFEFLPIGAYRSTPAGTQLRANAALVVLNGYRDEAEQLANVHDIAREWYVEPQRRAQFIESLERDGSVRGFVSEVYRHRTRERIWVSENAHVVRAADGAALYYEGTVEEISDRVAAEAALALSEAQLREIATHLPGVVFRAVVDPDGSRRLTFVSAGVRSLYGVDAATVLADPQGLHRLIHPDDQPHVLAELDAATRNRAPLTQECRIVAADGALKWVGMSTSTVTAGTPTEVRCGVILDITARRLAETALRESEERWKLALDGSGDGLWDVDLVTGSESYSQRIQELYGYTAQEIGGCHNSLDSHTHPDDRARMRRDRDEHFAGRAPRYVNEHRVRCKDGSWKWVLSRGLVIGRDADGRPLRMIGTHTDITDRKQADALRQERDRAEAADRAKTELLSRVSHELRTPLNAVLGFAQLLEQAGPLNQRQRDWVQHILSSGRHLLGLVDDVLDVSSAQSGTMSLAWSTVDPLAVAAESWTMLAAFADQAGVQLDTGKSAAAAPRVRADRRRLTQVMNNLLSNAIKYSRRGGRITVQAERHGDLVEVRVADNGPGLDAAQLERIFKPFDRLGAEQSAIEGTGLGLVLARQMMLAMNGEIRVASAPGLGTTFTLILQAAPDGEP